MKYKVGDKLRVLNPEKCFNYNKELENGAEYIKITSAYNTDKYCYDIFDDNDRHLECCSFCLEEKDLEYYDKPTEIEGPAQKGGLTYEKTITYTRSDGVVFEHNQVIDDEIIPIETLKRHSDLYKQWKRREF